MMVCVCTMGWECANRTPGARISALLMLLMLHASGSASLDKYLWCLL